MQFEIVASELVARHVAARLAQLLRDAVQERGRATLAVSGGRGPEPMFAALAERSVPWQHIHVLQVDERVAPAGHEERNLTSLEQHLLSRIDLPDGNLHAMPVDDGSDPDEAADRYERMVAEVAGTPAQLDVVHLGLGEDGHTASLVPDDTVLDVQDRDVAATAGAYDGRRRVTLTYPALARARNLIWLVTGASKAPAVERLVAADRDIPGGRVAAHRALLVVDPAAGELLLPARPAS